MENNFNELAAALCQFQSKMHAVGKNKEGYGYNYATLGKVIEFAYPTMTELGLSVCQMLDQVNGQEALTTVLMHSSGQFISGTYPLTQAGMKGVNNAQQMGAAISYARRYGLLAVLGLAAEDDDAHCLNEPPKKVKAAAKKLGMTVEDKHKDTMDKGQCLKAIEAVTAAAQLGGLYKGHEQRAKDEGWIDELVNLCAARKDELK